MVPDPGLQLQVVIKALGETVAPVIPANEKVAQEQLHLAMATLGILRSHLPMSRRFLRSLSRDAVNMADQLSEIVPSQGLAGPRAGLEAALADPGLEDHELEKARAELMEATCALLEGLEPEHREAARKVVIAASALPIERQRAWFIGSGFEPVPGKIRPISELIST